MTPHNHSARLSQVIKGMRDPQKLAKLAIYDVHRGNTDSAAAKLDDAMAKTKLLWPIIDAHPALRPGSFSNALEEWAEGKLYLNWLLNRTILTMSDLVSWGMS